MPVKQQISDSIQISVEVKYIKYVPGKANLDEAVTRYPARDELRDEVEKLLPVVRDKRTEQKEAVFGSIESKLESILDNLQNLKQLYVTKEAEKFLKDLREGEKHVQKCFSDSEICCWCIEISKPKFLTEELQRFDNCLESFDRILVNILQVEARESLKKAETRNDSVKIPEEVRKSPEKLASVPGKGVLTTRTLSAAPVPPGSGSGSGDSKQKARDSLTKAQFEMRDSSVNIPEKTRKSPEELVNSPGKGVSSGRTFPAAPTPSGLGSNDSNLQKARESLTKAQFEMRDSSVNIPEKTRKSPEELVNAPGKGVSSSRTFPAAPAPSGSGSGDSNLHEEQQKPVLKRISGMSKTEASNPSENNSTAHLDMAENKDVRRNDFTRSSISSDMSRESNKGKDSGSGVEEFPDYTTLLTTFVPYEPTTLLTTFVPYEPTTLLTTFVSNKPTTSTTVSPPDYTTALTTFVPDKPINRPARSKTSIESKGAKDPTKESL